ncbi:serine/threonine-protein kinase [Parafrankia sp. EUN1f]|uniref:serine/threonine-protein kinase n=1 Tax=Parafrankia sp. EUN1f TaxID=102897 RepID=UPI0001C47030|nr:serine/threonine-protein kinase [Parafrankia sp. EUN1f]EFC80529.1 serine/threonine protein kinase [Parafrankia sp. EUN1f]
MISEPAWLRAWLGLALPGFRVDGLLGRGAFGVVFECADELGRQVAVKVVDPSAFSGGQDAQAEALREARLLASVNHPHIVGIHRAIPVNLSFEPRPGFEAPGTLRAPRPPGVAAPGLTVILIVMELLPGGTLGDRLIQGIRSPEWSCAVVLAVATALAAAHDRRVLHRDVKPANILFTEDGRPKLTDFGIARDLEDSGVHTLHPAGTPRYMAPEQFRTDPLYPSADVYALGLVAFELFNGRMTVSGMGPEPASANHAGRVPEKVNRVIWTALAYAPSERHQNAREFAFELATAAAESWGKDWLTRAGFQAFLETDIQAAALGYTAPAADTPVPHHASPPIAPDSRMGRPGQRSSDSQPAGQPRTTGPAAEAATDRPFVETPTWGPAAEPAATSGPPAEPSTWVLAERSPTGGPGVEPEPAGAVPTGPSATADPSVTAGPLVASLRDGADPRAGVRGALVVFGLVTLIAALVLLAVVVYR